MARAKPIAVKLSDELLRRIDAAIKLSGLETRSAVIKFCLSTFLDDLERHGRSSFPPNWRNILRDMDQRTHRYDDVHVKRRRAKANWHQPPNPTS